MVAAVRLLNPERALFRANLAGFHRYCVRSQAAYLNHPIAAVDIFAAEFATVIHMQHECLESP